MATSLRQLRELSLVAVRMGSEDQHAAALFGELPLFAKLRVLNLRSVSGLSYEYFRDIISVSDQLEELHLGDLPRLRDSFRSGPALLRYMGQNLPNLAKLTIDSIPILSIGGIEGFTSLKSLRLEKTALGDLEPLVGLCNSLQSLELSSACSVSYIDDESSSPLVRRCAQQLCSLTFCLALLETMYQVEHIWMLPLSNIRLHPDVDAAAFSRHLLSGAYRGRSTSSGRLLAADRARLQVYAAFEQRRTTSNCEDPVPDEAGPAPFNEHPQPPQGTAQTRRSRAMGSLRTMKSSSYY